MRMQLFYVTCVVTRPSRLERCEKLMKTKNSRRFRKSNRANVFLLACPTLVTRRAKQKLRSAVKTFFRTTKTNALPFTLKWTRGFVKICLFESFKTNISFEKVNPSSVWECKYLFMTVLSFFEGNRCIHDRPTTATTNGSYFDVRFCFDISSVKLLQK